MVKLSDVTIHTIHFEPRRPATQDLRGRTLPPAARRDRRLLRPATISSSSTSRQAPRGALQPAHLGYVSTNTKQDGKYRKIKVEVDREDVKVRARRGYFGPAPEAPTPKG
jgi:hypothetical protein